MIACLFPGVWNYLFLLFLLNFSRHLKHLDSRSISDIMASYPVLEKERENEKEGSLIVWLLREELKEQKRESQQEIQSLREQVAYLRSMNTNSNDLQ